MEWEDARPPIKKCTQGGAKEGLHPNRGVSGCGPGCTASGEGRYLSIFLARISYLMFYV